jgi:signal transduction histidine kinase
MSGRGREIAILELHGRALYDIAQVLESAEGAEQRVLRALEMLRQLVPYEQCALLEAEAGFAPRVLAIPALSSEEKNLLTDVLLKLFGTLVEERAQVSGPPPSTQLEAHLAVPLIGLGEVIGVLFVRRAEGVYVTRHLQALSVVAAQIAAYLTMLRAVAADGPNRAKHELLDLMYGELRPPLAAALGALRILGSKDLPEAERARAVEVIERSIATQTRTIDDLLQVSGFLSGKPRLQSRAVEPARLIEAAIEGLRPLAEQRSIRLGSTLDSSVHSIAVDPERFHEILTSVIANAIKFTPDGGQVEIRLERAGASARIQLIQIQRGSRRAENLGEQKGVTISVELPLLGGGENR